MCECVRDECSEKETAGRRARSLSCFRFRYNKAVFCKRNKVERKQRNGKENLRETSYIMSIVLTIACSCVSKVHLYCSGQVTQAFLSYYVLSCVHFVSLQISELRFTQDKVRWLHVYLPQEHEWPLHVEIKSDPSCRDCSRLIKSAALFLCSARW